MKLQPHSVTLSNRAACLHFARDGSRLRPFRAVAADATHSAAIVNLLSYALSHNLINRVLFARLPHWSQESPT
jgi:hypothetical protein